MSKQAAAQTEAQATTEKRIPLKIKVGLEPYEFNGKKGLTVKAELVDPFPEYADIFNNVRIAPRWNKDAAIFKFRMRVYLRTHDDVVLDGYCVPVGFESAKPEEAGTMIYYPGIFFNMPYAAEPVEFGFKGKEKTTANGSKIFEQSSDSYVFRDIVSERWGGSYEPAAGDVLPDEDILL